VSARTSIFIPIAAVCLAYINSFGGVFQFDDYNVIVNNPVVHSFAAWVGDLRGGIRPILKLTYMLNFTSGAGAPGFHLVNLAIHLANTVMVYRLARALNERFFESRNGSVCPVGPAVPTIDTPNMSGAPVARHSSAASGEPGAHNPANIAALCAALLFGLHPVETEAVTYISGRSGSLAAFFYLASIAAYMGGAWPGGPTPGNVRTGAEKPGGDRPGAERPGGDRPGGGSSGGERASGDRSGGDISSDVSPVGEESMPSLGLRRFVLVYVASPLLFVFAVASKETAITLPAALLLIATLGSPRRGFKTALRSQAAHWSLSLAICLLLVIHPNHGRLLEYGFDLRGIGVNLLTEVNAVTYLISRLVVLNGLNIDPDLPIIGAWSAWLALKAIFLAAPIVAGIIMRRRRPWIIFGVLWFYLHLAATNSVVPRIDPANERQLYLASAGIFIAAGAQMAIFFDRISATASSTASGTASGEGAGMCAGLRLCARRAAIACAALLFVTLALSTISRNRCYLSEVALWEDARAKSPLKARVRNNLGYAYYLENRYAQARVEYLQALRLEPGFKIAGNNLAALSRADIKGERGF
jgi:hypothetical protein